MWCVLGGGPRSARVEMTESKVCVKALGVEARCACVCVERLFQSVLIQSLLLGLSPVFFAQQSCIYSKSQRHAVLEKAKRQRERREGKRERISDEIFVKEREGGRKGTYGERGLNWKLRE